MVTSHRALRVPPTLESTRCPRCRGNGTTGEASLECSLCSSHGLVPREFAASYQRELFVQCTECNGSGKVSKRKATFVKCPLCDGSGEIAAELAELSNDYKEVGERVHELIRRCRKGIVLAITVAAAVIAVRIWWK